MLHSATTQKTTVYKSKCVSGHLRMSYYDEIILKSNHNKLTILIKKQDISSGHEIDFCR
jgi:hypothetical protein